MDSGHVYSTLYNRKLVLRRYGGSVEAHETFSRSGPWVRTLEGNEITFEAEPMVDR